MTRLALAVACALVFAGCASSSDASGPLGRGDAGAPAFDASTGALTGYVVDDAFNPVPGATVGIQDSETVTVTDDAGSFGLGGLAPGPYQVFAQALGYQSQGRNVAVEAGAVVEVQFLLAPLPTEEPYTHTIPFGGLIECAWGMQGVLTGNCLPIQFLLQQNNLGNPTNTRIIGLFGFADREKIESGVFEMEWNPSAAMTSGSLLLNVESEQTGVINGKVYGSASGQSPVRVRTSDDPWKELVPTDQAKDQVQTRTFPAATNPPTVVVNQRFTVHATACYVEECGEIFTVIPDA